MYEGVPIRIRRPNDYNPVAASLLGPAAPSAELNLGALGVGLASSGSLPDQRRVLVGGLPAGLSDAQLRELLEPFGALSGLEVARDSAGRGKGFAFATWADEGVTDLACAGLAGLPLGGRQLTLQRLVAAPELPPAVAQHLAEAAAAPPQPPAPAPPTPVLVLDNAVKEEELRDDGEFADIEADMRDECARFGQLTGLLIPRPPAPGSGRVYVRFASTDQALAAHAVLHGRKFGGLPVHAAFLPLLDFEALTRVAAAAGL